VVCVCVWVCGYVVCVCVGGVCGVSVVCVCVCVWVCGVCVCVWVCGVCVGVRARARAFDDCVDVAVSFETSISTQHLHGG